jgi:hypothetical protein
MHVGSRDASSSAEAGARQPLLAACGRLVVVAAPGAPSIDVFDAADVAELSDVLGAGAAKMRFIAAFPVSDISAPVSVNAICFLRGGLLAVAGVCTRGAGECNRAEKRWGRAREEGARYTHA